MIVDFRLVKLNKTAEADIGQPALAIIGRTLRDLYPYAFRVGVFERYKAVVDSGQASKFEVHYPLPGEKRAGWLDISAVKLEDGLVMSYIDISARKEAVKLLQEQHALIDQVLNTAQSGILFFTAIRDGGEAITAFQVDYSNQKALELTGFAEGMVLSPTLLGASQGQEHSGVFGQLIEVARTGLPLRREHYDRHQNRWFDLSASRLANGVVASYTDITRIKESQQQLAEQNELLLGVLNGSLNCIIVYEAVRDTGGAITDLRVNLFNDAALVFFDLAADELQGHHFRQLYPAEVEQRLFQHCVQVIETGRPYRTVLDYPDQSVSVELAISRFGDGIIVGSSNITRLRASQRALERKNKELSLSNENLQQFAYVASHDLQEPLRKIQSFGDILVDQYSHQLGEHPLDLLRRMQLSSRRMANLIQDLLTYSRISTHREPFQPVSFQEVIDDVLFDLELTIREKSAKVETDPLPTLSGNRLQLRQLFQNLISNALKFSQPNEPPRVVIRAQPILYQASPDPAAAEQPYWQIDITDNGIGFDEKYLDRIFQIFQRLHGKASFSGTGIGLAICKKVVENHHGTLLARSQPGQGSTFTILLPSEAEQSQSA